MRTPDSSLNALFWQSAFLQAPKHGPKRVQDRENPRLGPWKTRWKITNFRNEFFSGSSDFKDEIWSQMESLGVLDVFYTTSECAATFTSNFSKMSFLTFFLGFSHFDGRNFDEEFFGMSS